MKTRLWREIILLASLIVWPAAAIGQAPHKTETLRDEVRAKGFAYRIFVTDSETPETPPTLDGLIAKSDAIIRGRVVDERTRLSEDEYEVLTDYTIEVREVFRDVSGKLAESDRVTVTAQGGNLVLEGRPVRYENMEFPPLPWIKLHIFFLTRQEGPNRSGWYYFTSFEAGVFPLLNGQIVCGAKTQPKNPLIGPYCGMDEERFTALIRAQIAASANTSPGGPQANHN